MGLEIVEIRIPPDSKTIGKPIKQIPLPKGIKLALVIPINRKPVIPKPSTVIREGDQIVALTSLELEEELRANLTGI